MSMFQYSFRMHEPSFFPNRYSIIPQHIICSFDEIDDDDFDLSQGLPNDKFTTELPELRVLGYKPKNELVPDITLKDNEPIDEERILSNMLKNPNLTLSNIYSTEDGLVYAEFYDKRERSRPYQTRSYAFYGKINVEVVYKNTPPKLYKFRTAKKWIDIMEMDDLSFRNITLEYPDEDGHEGIVQVCEYKR